METRDELRKKLDQLEKRFDQLQGEIGAIVELALSLEMTVEQLVERAVIPQQHLVCRIGFALDLYRNQCGPAVARELSRIQDSMLDAQIESFDEKDLPCA